MCKMCVIFEVIWYIQQANVLVCLKSKVQVKWVTLYLNGTVSIHHTNADIHHSAMQETLEFIYTHIQCCFTSLSFIIADVSDNMFITFRIARILVSIFKQCVLWKVFTQENILEYRWYTLLFIISNYKWQKKTFNSNVTVLFEWLYNTI